MQYVLMIDAIISADRDIGDEVVFRTFKGTSKNSSEIKQNTPIKYTLLSLYLKLFVDAYGASRSVSVIGY